MVNRQSSPLGWLVVSLLLFSSTLTVVQFDIVSQSYGQYVTQTTHSPPPGLPTTWRGHIGNRTWTRMANQTWSWIHIGNRTFTRRGNQSWTWSYTGNQSWTHIENQTWTWNRIANQTHTYYSGNQTWTWTGPLGPPGRGNETRRNGQVPPGLVNGWAHSNVTVGARNVAQPLFMNGTDSVRLSHIAINASSAGQIIRNIAFNQTVTQIEFDRNGTLQLIINSSVKPTQVFADDLELSESQSLNGLTPTSEMWYYNQSNQALTSADPSSITIFYAPTAPVPEFPTPLEQAIVIYLAVTLILEKKLTNTTQAGLPPEQDDSENERTR